MNFTELLAGMGREDDGAHQTIPPEWAQGRTAYGGLTAALSAAAITQARPDLPPLRSAQIGFVGPAAGQARITYEVLRQGRSTTFISSDLHGEAGLATRSLFVFGGARESKIEHTDMPRPDVPGLGDVQSIETHPPFPAFLTQFEIKIARGGLPFTGQGEHRSFWWVRHRDERARSGLLPLLALADVTPPAISPVVSGLAPVSSVTWQIDFLTDDPATDEGWYLVETSAQSARDGWSAQDMRIWASDGRPVAAHRQSIVLFG